MGLDLQRRVRGAWLLPQADAFITLDAELAASLQGIVTTASIDALGQEGRFGVTWFNVWLDGAGHGC